MRPRSHMLPLIVLTTLLMACGQATVPEPAPLSVDENGDAVHTIIEVHGQMAVKRAGWNQYAPALFGTICRQGDLVRLEESSRATVACADLTLVSVAPGIGGVPCKAQVPVLTYAGSLVNPTRGGVTGEFPVIVSPRKTRILGPQPTLRWMEVVGATGYHVRVHGPELDWDTAVGNVTEVRYPPEAPALVPGVTYKLTVSARGRTSDEEAMPGLGFSLLSPDEAATVQAAEAKIRTLELSEGQERYLVASLYAAQGLVAEATEQLETLARTVQEPEVERFLGDLYLKTGLTILAEDHYLRAIDYARQANDTEGEAWAGKALGMIYEARGNAAEAQRHLQGSLALYRRLGDESTVKELEDRLAALPKP